MHTGDLVQIIFRKKRMNGIIRCIKKSSNIKRLSTIESIVYAGLLSKDDLIRFEYLARHLATSPCQLLYSALLDGSAYGKKRSPPVTQKSVHSFSIRTSEQSLIQSALKEKDCFVQLSKQAQHALAIIVSKRHKHTLIIASTAQEAHELANYVPNALLLFGAEGIKQKKDIMRAWRDHGGTLIGTKQASLLPTPSLSAVVLLNFDSEDYRFQMRNPRINPALASILLARQHKTYLYKTATSAPIAKQSTLLTQPIPPTKIVHLGDGTFNDHIFIHKKTLEQAKLSLQSGKKLLFLLNRKPTEQETALNTVSNYLTQELQIPVVSVSAESAPIPDARVICATKSIFNHLGVHAKKQFGLVVNVFADISMQSDALSSEQTYRELCELAFFAKQQGAQFIIQTFNPELFVTMLEQASFLEEQQKIRFKYSLPPFCSRVIIDGVTELPENLKRVLPINTQVIHSNNQIILQLPPKTWHSIADYFRMLPNSITITLLSHSYL